MRFLRTHWPWWLVVGLLAAGLARVRLDVEVLNLLPTDLPAVRGLKIYQGQLANGRELMVTVRGRDAEETERAARAVAEALRARRELVASVVWQPWWQEGPARAAEWLAFLWLNQPPEVVAGLTNRLAGTNVVGTLARTREALGTSLSPLEIARLSYDPLDLAGVPQGAMLAAGGGGRGTDFFASEDGTFRVLFVEAAEGLAGYRECAAWLGKIRKVAAGAGIGEVELGFTGRPAFVAEIAAGMEGDMRASVAGTGLLVAAMFWLAHRRWLPLLWLLAVLGLTLLGTLAAGGLIFGTLSVVSLGFAAILLGLAVDYGLILYQEARSHPGATIEEVRRAQRPGIVGGAVTTAGAFAALNAGGLPGLAQLGTLVAIGIVLAAAMMLGVFVRPLGMLQRGAGRAGEGGGGRDKGGTNRPTLWATGLFGVLVVAGLSWRWPVWDASAAALRPRASEAYAAMEAVRSHLQGRAEPLWLVVTGRTEAEVAARMREAEEALKRLVASGVVKSFSLPRDFWPTPGRQEINRPLLAGVAERETELRRAVLAEGFTGQAWGLTEAMLGVWRGAAGGSGVFWPTNEMSRWVLGRFAARAEGTCVALGLVEVPAGSAGRVLREWPGALGERGIFLSGWELLGLALAEHVRGRLWPVMGLMVGLVGLALWLTFRRWLEVALGFLCLGFSVTGLGAIMGLMGWSWNLLNLMALPLLLGAGVDYGLHVMHALRRTGGDVGEARATVGRALMLCAATTVAGFGSLAWASNAGMASLGRVCAAGVAVTYLVAVYLLPTWWLRLGGVGGGEGLSRSAGMKVAGPSVLYGAWGWRVARGIVGVVPRGLLRWIAGVSGLAYWAVAGHRRAVVRGNLSPVLGGGGKGGSAVTRQLFREFGMKLADLWRFEAGLPMKKLMNRQVGTEHLAAARASGRGILLVTIHLGNWELGAVPLAELGVKLLVVTLAEPGTGLTELRSAARGRLGVETLVIGEDMFAFVEIIKRLEAGGVVALLVDRPPATGAVAVEFCGRELRVSSAAAELARASGCVVLPVVVPRVGTGYETQVLPAVIYDRRELGERSARVRFAGEIVRAFEPVVRQYPEQWFHFVPIWPRG